MASPSEKQIRYIECLLIDCGFRSIKERNLWLQSEFERNITALDELSGREASRAIDLLQEMKEEKWEEEARGRGYDASDDYRK